MPSIFMNSRNVVAYPTHTAFFDISTSWGVNGLLLLPGRMITPSEPRPPILATIQR